MPRINVPFVVDKQHITQPTGEKLVSGGQNYFYATFVTNEIWENISMPLTQGSMQESIWRKAMFPIGNLTEQISVPS